MKRTCLAVLVLAMTIFAHPADAAATGEDLFLVSVGRGPGAQSSFWYVTVWIYNPSSRPADVDVSFLERDSANPAPIHSTMTVDPGETATVNDALFNLFGLDVAFGALRIRSDQEIVVAARSYNLTAAGLADSQGQFMAAFPAELAIAAGESTSIPGITQPADGSFRCNFAVVEAAGAAAEIDVRLLDPAGMQLASASFAIAPYEPRQINIGQLNGVTTVDGGRIEVSVRSGAGRVLALGSMVGNGSSSQDPSTLEMKYELGGSAMDPAGCTPKRPESIHMRSSRETPEATGRAISMQISMAAGDLNVTGTKNCRIDHPFDPTGAYLVHAAVESSEVLNQYSGTAHLDEDGTAVIERESWFSAINTDLRYQLTAIGAAAPNLHISQEAVDNRFEIAGGPPGLKVSWQITARRNDAYMRQHPFEVDVAKTGIEIGTYLCPECHGQPESKSAETAILTMAGPRYPTYGEQQ